jgi:hypothetical protein
MRRFLAAAAAACVLACGANAGVYSDDMSKCLVKSTSADDQLVFIQWVFSAMALHPGVKSMANISDEQRRELTAKTGALMIRLMTRDCRAETIAALKYEGGAAMEQSFALFGQAAMRGLMGDPQVAQGMGDIGSFGKDPAMIALFKEAGMPTEK